MKKLCIGIVSICFIVRVAPATESSPPKAATRAVVKPPEKREEYHSAIKVTTDSFGNVTKAVVVSGSDPIVDRNTVKLAIAQWKGPPNSSRVIQVVYRVAGETPVTSSKNPKLVGPGWRMPRPPYPAKAIAAHAEGKGVIRISTNRDGRVEKVEIIKKIHPLLDEHTSAFALAHWTGPPNTTRDVPVTYALK
jgi:Gram-negative bacterial TonB protein C-terminal